MKRNDWYDLGANQMLVKERELGECDSFRGAGLGKKGGGKGGGIFFLP